MADGLVGVAVNREGGDIGGEVPAAGWKKRAAGIGGALPVPALALAPLLSLVTSPAHSQSPNLSGGLLARLCLADPAGEG